MKSFKSYITEKYESRPGLSLTAFDIDETLMQTFANIYVMKNGELVHKLNNQQFNTYKLKDGEEFDFREFRDAKKFNETSKPIEAMFAKARAILANASRKGSKVILLTARADFDDKKTFLDTFRKHGLNIDEIYVERAGNLGGPAAHNKVRVLQRYIDSGMFKRIRLFDDAVSNLRAVQDMKHNNPGIEFETYLVDAHTGKVKTYR